MVALVSTAFSAIFRKGPWDRIGRFGGGNKRAPVHYPFVETKSLFYQIICHYSSDNYRTTADPVAGSACQQTGIGPLTQTMI